MAARETLRDRSFVLLQRLLPRRALTRLIYRLTRIRQPLVKNLTIRGFIRLFRVATAEAENPVPDGFSTFNDFFTRALKAGARPLPERATAFVSPCDGRLSQFGEIRDGSLLQAKGHDYTVAELLGDAEAARAFAAGRFATVYLAPYDYHRVHMPFAGRLTQDRCLGADLYSVNDATARLIDRLFVRNERLVALFETATGPMAVVMIGALNVGSITTIWGGETRAGLGTARNDWQPRDLELDRGELIGWFNMGSTVIVLTSGDEVDWLPGLDVGQTLRQGEAIGEWYRRPTT